MCAVAATFCGTWAHGRRSWWCCALMAEMMATTVQRYRAGRDAQCIMGIGLYERGAGQQECAAHDHLMA